MKEQLVYLKGIMERTGAIHEAQALQIRNYPRLIPNIKKAETTISPDSHMVIYDCVSEKKNFRKSKKINEAIVNVVEWIRFVLWNDTTVELKVNGKCVYDSRIN